MQRSIKKIGRSWEEEKLKKSRDEDPVEEVHTTSRTPTNSSPIDDPISVEELIVVESILKDREVQVHEDDGCSINIISGDLIRKSRGRFSKKTCDIRVEHSS